MRPLVSIITPCHNDGRFVRGALDAVRASLYRPLEHVVIDDASTDDSRRILAALQPEYGFTLLCLDRNVGPAAARNLAIARSRGDYLLPLDCDNLIPPNYISTLVRAAETAAAAEMGSPFYTDVQFFGARQHRKPRPEWSPHTLMARMFVDTCSLFRRRAFAATGGFDPNCSIMEDFEFFLGMAIQGFQGQRVAGTQLHYCIRPDSYNDNFQRQDGASRRLVLFAYAFAKHGDRLRALGWDRIVPGIFSDFWAGKIPIPPEIQQAATLQRQVLTELAAGRYVEAEQVCKRAIAIAPHQPAAYNAWGWVLLCQHRWEPAARAYGMGRALSRSPATR